MEFLNTPLVFEDDGSSVLIILIYPCFPFLALEAEVLIMYNNCTHKEMNKIFKKKCRVAKGVE